MKKERKKKEKERKRKKKKEKEGKRRKRKRRGKKKQPSTPGASSTSPFLTLKQAPCQGQTTLPSFDNVPFDNGAL